MDHPSICQIQKINSLNYFHFAKRIFSGFLLFLSTPKWVSELQNYNTRTAPSLATSLLRKDMYRLVYISQPILYPYSLHYWFPDLVVHSDHLESFHGTNQKQGYVLLLPLHIQTPLSFHSPTLFMFISIYTLLLFDHIH